MNNINSGIQAYTDEVAYWRVTFRMYHDDADLCVLNVAGSERPTLDSINVTPRPHGIISTEPYFVKHHHWDKYGERCLNCGDKDWMNDPVCRPRLADPSVEATPSIAVDPSTEVTPMTESAPTPVTDAMVELACNAFTAEGRRERALPSLSPRWMRAALEAAMQATSKE